MNEDAFRVMDLGMKGYRCSQIVMATALEALGKDNEDLLRAMSGLLQGMGTGKNCGALTGGCCVLGLYAGWGTPESTGDERLPAMLEEFVEWFESEYEPQHGGINCDDIVGDDTRHQVTRCPGIVIQCVGKLKEILANNHYEFGHNNPA